MNILTIILVIVFVGVALWFINNYIPMDGKIKKILNIVIVIALVIWLLKIAGVFSSLNSVRV